MGEFTAQGPIFGNARLYRNKKNKIWVQGNFSSPSIQVKGETLESFSGNVVWDNQTQHLNRLSLHGGEHSSSFTLDSQLGEVGIVARNLSAASICQNRRHPGQRTARRNHQKNRHPGQQELDPWNRFHRREMGRPTPNRPSGSPARSSFQQDLKSKDFRFSAEKAFFNDGQFSIKGKTNSRTKTAEIRVSAVLNRLEHVHPLADFYSRLDLETWRLEKGTGAFDLTFIRTGANRQIKQPENGNFVARASPSLTWTETSPIPENDSGGIPDSVGRSGSESVNGSRPSRHFHFVSQRQG